MSSILTGYAEEMRMWRLLIVHSARGRARANAIYTRSQSRIRAQPAGTGAARADRRGDGAQRDGVLAPGRAPADAGNLAGHPKADRRDSTALEPACAADERAAGLIPVPFGGQGAYYGFRNLRCGFHEPPG